LILSFIFNELLGYTNSPKQQLRKGVAIPGRGFAWNAVSRYGAQGSLFVFRFGNDVLPLALGAFHGKSHTTAQRENINHQTAAAVAAESLFRIGFFLLHGTNIPMKK
jgi:hypothetical protein